MGAMTCARCGLGSIKDVDSALAKRAWQRPGFRPTVVYVHKNEAVCSVVNEQRQRARERAAKYDNVWFRRLARKVRSWV